LPARRPVLSDITVVIPTIGRPILEQCLLHVARGSYWPAAMVVVDQGRSAAVGQWIERLSTHGLVARHVPSSERGKAAALNRAIECVTTPGIAITDDDCLVAHDWLETLARHLRLMPAAVVTGPALATGEERPVAAVTGIAPRVSTRPGFTFDTFCGSNMGAGLDTMARVGPFDEDPAFVAAAEDCEWAYRALRQGVPIVYRPELVVHHVSWRGVAERDDRWRAYARSHGSFYGKYLRRGDWRIAVRVFLHHARALKRWGTGVVRGDREQAANGRAYVTGLLPGIVGALRARDR
jgi:GT2 family glycosyltransferase